MDYKELYEQALERARQFSEKPYLEDSALIVEYIFPELEESEDERIRKHLIKHFGNKSKEEWNGVPVKDILAWLEKQGEKKPAEWSEKDEKHINSLLERLKGLCKNEFTRTTFAINEDEEWLKSLRNRVLPQAKQEWGEEDEEILKELTKFIPYHLTAHSYNQYYNWAISHRPQPHWKPSESDILLLEEIANGKSNPQDFQASLGGLIGQLKKLMEE